MKHRLASQWLWGVLVSGGCGGAEPGATDSSSTGGPTDGSSVEAGPTSASATSVASTPTSSEDSTGIDPSVASGSDGEGDGSSSGGIACVSIEPRAVTQADATADFLQLVQTAEGWVLAWADTRDGGAADSAEIYALRLDEAGDDVGDELRVTTAAGSSVAPSMAVVDDGIALAWHDDRDGNTEIYFTRIDADFVEVDDDVRVTNDDARSEAPTLLGASDGYALAWTDTRDTAFQAWFARLDDAGARVGDEVRVSTDDALSANTTMVAGDGGYGIVWHDMRDGSLQIYFALVDEAGVLVDEQRVSEEIGGNPQVAWNGDAYGVTWWGTPGAGGEIQFVRVDPDGVASAPIDATSTGSTAFGSALVARDGGWALAWSDRRDPLGDPDAELWFVQLDGDGVAVGDEQRLSDDAIDSVNATIAPAPAGGYAIAWLDRATEETDGTPRFAVVCP